MDIKKIRIHVPTEELSRQVQEKLISLGARWPQNPSFPQYLFSKYLFVSWELYLGYSSIGSGKEFFEGHHYKEVTYQYILNMKMTWKDRLQMRRKK